MFLLVVSFLFAIIVVVSIYLHLSESHMKYVKMPPCLYRYIFLGNIPYLLKKKTPVHTYFEFLSKDIGSVFTFWFGDCPAVIINDFQMAKKLLYSKECTGRPQRYTGEMYSRGFKGIITTTACPALRTRRNIAHKSLRFLENTQIEELLKSEVNFFIKSITLRMGNTDNLQLDLSDDVSLMSCNLIWMLLFNERFSPQSEEFAEVQQMLEWLNDGLLLSNLLQGFPILRKIPLGKFLFINSFKTSRDRLIRSQTESHRDRLDKNCPKDFTDMLLMHDELSEDNVEIILSDILVAGFETVASTLQFMILYLIKNKNIAQKCYEEVDKILEGDDDLKLTDLDNFHYVKAVISETMRITPAAPLGVPHITVNDLSIMEYVIPRNTTLFINIYAIHHDGNLHHQPEVFNPERFLDENREYKSINGFLPFSLGRRQCLGKELALKELVYFTVNVLRKFWLEAPDDGQLPIEYISKTTLKPDNYEVKLSKRHDKNCNITRPKLH
ncbi:steroid 17-alpha-hydroxylase/17,20 lyase-like [Hydractinia symbiolongicarpus]|uniref:steroid 17-alpha-hydroxylase/17,20 lyase-like n=1 Tax=Hydractinia symbiolongicarpus TaxID=13093 RepID=UPI002550C8AE|nr:steroid 17-alpha-hydroxylase/17,20 lyase-like [Hydractinia symbiolongicarpus]XP_057307339.1 steroid 17-alpha-hydroxylase/17,20 lyase-like [Hydractinia symbiolongicarpus]